MGGPAARPAANATGAAIYEFMRQGQANAARLDLARRISSNGVTDVAAAIGHGSPVNVDVRADAKPQPLTPEQVHGVQSEPYPAAGDR